MGVFPPVSGATCLSQAVSVKHWRELNIFPFQALALNSASFPSSVTETALLFSTSISLSLEVNYFLLIGKNDNSGMESWWVVFLFCLPIQDLDYSPSAMAILALLAILIYMKITLIDIITHHTWPANLLMDLTHWATSVTPFMYFLPGLLNPKINFLN